MRTLLIATAMVTVLAGCGSGSATYGGTNSSTPPSSTEQHQYHVDGPVYDSAQDLSSAAQVVAEVEYVSAEASGTEGGLFGQQASGLPTTVWRVEVTQAVKGTSAPVLYVLQVDAAQVEDAVPVTVGDRAVLFLNRAPYKWNGNPTYVPVGVGQGVVPVLDGQMQPEAGPSSLQDELSGQPADELAQG